MFTLVFLVFLSCQPEDLASTKRITLFQEEKNLEHSNLSQILIYGGQKASADLGQHYVFIAFTHKGHSLANLKDSSKWSGCGGAPLLFHDESQIQWIYTAAHCMKANIQNHVVFPDQNTQSYSDHSRWCSIPANHVFLFPEWPFPFQEFDYTTYSYDYFENQVAPNDIALLKLPSDCSVPSWIKPLPIIQNLEQLRSKQTTLFLAGFGAIDPHNLKNSQTLQQLTYDVDHLSKHTNRYHQIIGKQGSTLTGDSGSPLVIEHQGKKAIAGSLFGGISPKETSGPFYSSYANVLNAVGWMERITGLRLVRLGEKVTQTSQSQPSPTSSKNQTCVWLNQLTSSQFWMKTSGAPIKANLPHYQKLVLISVIDSGNSHLEDNFMGVDFYVDLQKEQIKVQSRPLWIHQGFLEGSERICFDGKLLSPWR